jgi:hypothetical protein
VIVDTKEVPVALIVFNRPDVTKQLINALRANKPKKIFVIADGPRVNRPGEVEKCSDTRAALALIDWPCEIETNFSDDNLGCKRRVVSGLDWVFSKTDKAIILEDDCIPSPDFVPYCENLLELYKDSDEIGIISGSTLDSEVFDSPSSYFLSNYPRVWGWATWARTWRLYDAQIEEWPTLKKSSFLEPFVSTRSGRRYWRSAFDGVHLQKIDTWDYQLAFSLWKNGLKTAAPNKNLICNVGFGPEATHTLNALSVASGLKTFNLEFPLKHPKKIAVDFQRDNYMEIQIFQKGLGAYILSAFAKLVAFIGLDEVAKAVFGKVINFIAKAKSH